MTGGPSKDSKKASGMAKAQASRESLRGDLV